MLLSSYTNAIKGEKCKYLNIFGYDTVLIKFLIQCHSPIRTELAFNISIFLSIFSQANKLYYCWHTNAIRGEKCKYLKI